MPELHRLTAVTDLDAVLATTAETPVLVFKHSLSCHVSAAAYGELQRFLAARPADDPVAYRLVEVQRARDVSNELARRTGVHHESPQALLLRRGDVLWHASHRRITAASLAAAVDSASPDQGASP